MALSSEFIGVHRSLETVLRGNPRTEPRTVTQQLFLEVDHRPAEDLRVQLSHDGERGALHEDGTISIGRISVTGTMDTTMTPERGWHTFDLMHDGNVVIGGSNTQPRSLKPDQIAELGSWMTSREAAFIAG